MVDLRDTVNRLSQQFAAGILDAIRSASLEDISALTGAGGSKARGRPAAAAAPEAPAAPSAPASSGRSEGSRRRRSAEEIQSLADEIARLLKSKPDGMRAEEIREALEVGKQELPRALKAALGEKSIRKKGEKRATTYFASGTGGKVAPPKKRANNGKPNRAAEAPSQG